jgi:hypothetical protein
MEVLSPELVLVDEQLAAAARSALAPPPDVIAAIERARATGDAVRNLRDSFRAQQAAAEAVRRRRPGFRRRFAAVTIAALLGVTATVAAVVALGRDDVTSPRALAANAPVATNLRTAEPKPAQSFRAQRPSTTQAAKATPDLTLAASTDAPTQLRPGSAPDTPRPAAARHAPAGTVSRSQPAPAVGTMAVHARPAAVLTWPLRRQATYYRVRVYSGTGERPFLFEVRTVDTRLTIPSTWDNTGERRRLAHGVYLWAVFPTFGDLGEARAGTKSKPIAAGRFTV